MTKGRAAVRGHDGDPCYGCADGDCDRCSYSGRLSYGNPEQDEEDGL